MFMPHRTVVPFLALLLIFARPLFSESRIPVLVYPFQNTGRSDFNWIGAGMTDSVISGLRVIAGYDVFTEEDRKKVVRELTLQQTGLTAEAKQIGQLLGAKLIFTGSYLVVGEKVRVFVRLVDVESGKVEKSANVDGTMNDLFGLMDRVALQLAKDASDSMISDNKSVHVTQKVEDLVLRRWRPSPKAFELYSRGLEIAETNPPGALELFDQAARISPDYAEALVQAGWICSSRTLFDRAAAYLSSASAALQRRNEDRTVDQANLLMVHGMLLWEQGNLEGAMGLYQKARVLLEDLKLLNSGLYAALTMNMGLIRWQQGRLGDATILYEKCREISKGLGLTESSNYSLLMMNMGLVHWQLGQSDEAMAFFEKSKALSEKLGLTATGNFALLLMNMGLVDWQKGRLDDAMIDFEHSRSLYERLGLANTGNYALVLLNMGLIRDGQGRLDEAMDFYQKAKELHERLGLTGTDGYALVMMNMGVVLDRQGHMDEAMALYKKSRALYESMGLSKTENYALLIVNMGILHHRQGDNRNAANYLLRAAGIYRRLGLNEKATNAEKRAEEYRKLD